MFILILILIFQSCEPCVYALDNTPIYARILFEQCYFYKTPYEDNSISNIHFELPKTYFVELLSLNNNFYEARYLNQIGYVKKDCVQAVETAPSNPFLTDINFRVFAEPSQNIYSSPTKSNSQIISQIPPLSTNVQYIGKVVGDPLIEDRTNIWYYCKYSSNKDYYGYVYSDFCDKMPEILDNTEELEYIDNPTFSTPTETINAIPKNSNVVGIIIAILSIPALIFVLMIMKGSKILHKEKSKRKEVIDY